MEKTDNDKKIPEEQPRGIIQGKSPYSSEFIDVSGRQMKSVPSSVSKSPQQWNGKFK